MRWVLLLVLGPNSSTAVEARGKLTTKVPPAGIAALYSPHKKKCLLLPAAALLPLVPGKARDGPDHQPEEGEAVQPQRGRRRGRGRRGGGRRGR